MVVLLQKSKSITIMVYHIDVAGNRRKSKGKEVNKKGYKYRLRVQTDAGKIWNTYTVKGAWNIDTY